MQLSREKIQRMIGSTVGGSGGAGGDAGYASQSWVEENYLSKEFFNRLFTIHGDEEYTITNDNNVEETTDAVLPNDVETNVLSIEAMFGLWTEKFLSALGLNSDAGSSVVAALYDLLDVKRNGNIVYGASEGKVLMYGSDGKWYAGEVQGGGGGGSVTGIGMTVPTGLLVSGGTSQSISTSGTFALTFASGYSIPTNLKQEAWDDLIDNFDANGNAKAALKLTTGQKTVWGQTFWTENGVPQDVTGDLIIDDTIYRKIVFGRNSDNPYYYVGRSNETIVIGIKGTELYAFADNQLYSTVEIHSTVGVLSDGYVTALSDIRLKNVVSHFCLDVDQIASASLIRFMWKDKDDHTLHAGGIAQEWQKILPESVVETADGRLAMDYGVIGVASAVSLARKVKEQQKEIDELKRMNESLEKRLARLERMFAINDEED